VFAKNEKNFFTFFLTKDAKTKEKNVCEQGETSHDDDDDE